jgi:hypothetical protein
MAELRFDDVNHNERTSRRIEVSSEPGRGILPSMPSIRLRAAELAEYLRRFMTELVGHASRTGEVSRQVKHSENRFHFGNFQLSPFSIGSQSKQSSS